jgi:site-specific recombinase XerD
MEDLLMIARVISEKVIPEILSEEIPKVFPKVTLEEKSHNGFVQVRNIAVVELFHASGIRHTELVGLNAADIDLQRRSMRVIGKGNRERMVLFNHAAEQAMTVYLGMRPRTDDDALFLTEWGIRLTRLHAGKIIRRCSDFAVSEASRKNSRTRYELEEKGPNGFLQVRNSAMVELFYASGISRAELVGLNAADIDLQRRSMRVIGKGNGERIVSFNDAAEQAMTTYLGMRPRTDDDAFFLSESGTRLTPNYASTILRRCSDFAAREASRQNSRTQYALKEKNHNGFFHVRNIAVVELFYTSGIDRTELIGLNTADIDLQRRSMRVIGKGNRERMVSFNDAAEQAMTVYLGMRPRTDDDAFFLTESGTRLSREHARIILRGCSDFAVREALRQNSRTQYALEEKNPNGFLHVRNIAMVELFYASGIDRTELVGVSAADIDLQRRSMRVIGKGNGERIVSLNDAAEQAMTAYLGMRPRTDDDAFFLSESGTRLTPNYASTILRRCSDFAAREASRQTSRTQYALEEKNPNGFYRVRNTAIVELMSASGIGRAELVDLNAADIDLQRRSMRVIGKDNRQRMVSFNHAAEQAMTAYLGIRPRTDEDAFFLSEWGTRLGYQQATSILRSCGYVAVHEASPQGGHTQYAANSQTLYASTFMEICDALFQLELAPWKKECQSQNAGESSLEPPASAKMPVEFVSPPYFSKSAAVKLADVNTPASQEAVAKTLTSLFEGMPTPPQSVDQKARNVVRKPPNFELVLDCVYEVNPLMFGDFSKSSDPNDPKNRRTENLEKTATWLSAMAKFLKMKVSTETTKVYGETLEKVAASFDRLASAARAHDSEVAMLIAAQPAEVVLQSTSRTRVIARRGTVRAGFT